RDVHEHHAQRRFLPYRGTAQLVRTRPLRATLEVLRLHLIQLLPQPLELRVLLGDAALEVRQRSTVLVAARCGVAVTRFLRLLGRTRREYLVVAAAVTIHRDAFAIHVVRELVDLPHVVDRGRVREVRRFADGRVAVLLKGRLHLDVPFGRDLVRRDEHT